MSKKPLRVVQPKDQALGLPTIMNPALAAKHGVPYVRLAAFAIDVDRIREAAGDTDERPFGWEVFLTEIYMLENFDPASPRARSIIEDTCLDIIELEDGAEVLGSQIPFAVFDAAHRDLWDKSMAEVLSQWRRPSKELFKELSPLFTNGDENVIELAKSCLMFDLDPPLPTPTIDTLRWMIEARSGNKQE